MNAKSYNTYSKIASGKGGIKCYCCNPFSGPPCKTRKRLRRWRRRCDKQQVRKDVMEQSR